MYSFAGYQIEQKQFSFKHYFCKKNSCNLQYLWLHWSICWWLIGYCNTVLQSSCALVDEQWFFNLLECTANQAITKTYRLISAQVAICILQYISRLLDSGTNCNNWRLHLKLHRDTHLRFQMRDFTVNRCWSIMLWLANQTVLHRD